MPNFSRHQIAESGQFSKISKIADVICSAISQGRKRKDSLLGDSKQLMLGGRIQKYSLFCAPGLVKFVPAVARLFCLALSGSFLNMFAQNKEDLCIVISKPVKIGLGR